MKKIKFNRQICLAAVAFMLLAGACVKDAMAYFTTYATAKGSVQMNLEFTETVPNDDVKDKVKTVSVTNDKDYPCFVRLKVFVGNKFSEVVSILSGSNWNLEDGYYKYNAILEPGVTTSDFKVDLTQAFAIKPEAGDLDEFNVIIIQECAPVVYDSNGNAYADWSGSHYTIYED